MNTNKKVSIRTLAILYFVLAAPYGDAGAITLDAMLNSLGGSSYRYDYVLTNDGSLGAGIALQSFDIFFPTSQITSYTEIGAAAGDWTETPSFVLGDATFTADANTGGIPVGGSESFWVSFTWNGTGMPGVQDFNIYDPSDYHVLYSGQTHLVPEPSTLSVLVLGGLGLLALRRKATE